MRVLKAVPLLAILCIAGNAAGEVRFISPASGAQSIGLQSLEVTTTTAAIDRVEFRVDGILAGVIRTAPWRLDYDFGTSVATHQITADVFSSHYRKHETASVRTAASTLDETVTVHLVEVPIRIAGRAKIPDPTEISIRENGVPQHLLDFRSERAPMSFIFVIDRSSSMGHGKLDAALTAVGHELATLHEGDDASVVFFNHIVDPPKAVGHAREIESLPVLASGGTSVRDAVASVHPDRGAAFIVITDGSDRNSSLSAEEALRRVSRSNVTVFALALGRGNATDFLSRAARNTGGQVLDSSPTRIAADLSTIMADINSRWIASYQSSNLTTGWRTIEVSGRRGISVTSGRNGYWAQ